MELAAVAFKNARRLNGRGDCMDKFVTHRSVAAKQKCAADDVKLHSSEATVSSPRCGMVQVARGAVRRPPPCHFRRLNLSPGFAFFHQSVGILVKR
jgi:hypothetical protein